MGRWLFVLVGLAVLAVLIAFRLIQHHAAAVAQAQQQKARLKAPPVVGVATATVRDIVSTFSTLGNVQAPDQVRLSAQSTGRIISLSVQPGDPVTRGELLVQIDPSQMEAQVQQQRQAVASATANYHQAQEDYAAQVATAMAAVTDARSKVSAATAQSANARAQIVSQQANVTDAQLQYNRTNTLFQEGAIAKQNLDTARGALGMARGQLGVAQSQLNSAIAARQSALAELQSAQQQADIARTKGLTDIQAARGQVGQAQAQLANAQAQYSQTELRSPVDGFVAARLVDPGTVVTPGQEILALQYVKQVWVTISVPVELGGVVSVGQTATVTLDGLPGRTFIGRVTQVTPAADPVSRQFPVQITLDNPNLVIKPGMYAHVTLVTGRVRHATVVPPEAVQKKGAASIVDVVGPNNAVEVRTVVTGASDPNGKAIVSGVRLGERVVTLSGGRLKNGQQVQIGSFRAPSARPSRHKRG